MIDIFSGIQSHVKQSMEVALKRILTPKTSVDLLRDIAQAQAEKRPYTIVFIGVNGVGKSTNLSKTAFWLLQNNLKILIAACDTFRSGAVEQLRVHVRNLKALEQNAVVDLYEKGYGKDAASIAKEAISSAKLTGHDVVLIDTAGRMQDNDPLMRALAKVWLLARDEIGEAVQKSTCPLSQIHSNIGLHFALLLAGDRQRPRQDYFCGRGVGG